MCCLCWLLLYNTSPIGISCSVLWMANKVWLAWLFSSLFQMGYSLLWVSICVYSAYITLKDHKENFRSNPTCKLINPTKSEIGKISKQILDRINKELLKATKVNQWKNSDAVIKWFNAIKKKPNAKFITFDVVNFYRTITKELLLKALDFAENYTKITDIEKDIIVQAKHTTQWHSMEESQLTWPVWCNHGVFRWSRDLWVSGNVHPEQDQQCGTQGEHGPL